MPLFSVLVILLFIASSITAFDIQYTRAKKTGEIPSEEPNLPKWVMFIYLIVLGLSISIIVIDWKRALIVFFFIFIFSGFVPVLDIVGNILMRPFRPKR